MQANLQTRSSFHGGKRGFALIVTLSLMILLTVIAVGLLTLSSISLRASGQSQSMAVARANARLALMLAIGDLQKYAGPDQRVTARADILDTPTKKIQNPRLTGVWKSWDIRATTPPSAAEYEKPARDAKFLGWLASSIDGIAAGKIPFADNPPDKDPTKSVTLWGKGSLGTAALPADLVSAIKVPTGGSRGAFAYAVMDEGVKVRINTPYVDGATVASAKTAQLGTGARPNAAALKGLEKLERRFFEKDSKEYATVKKGISWLNLGLAAETLAAGTSANLKTLGHDVTSTAAGIFTDTAVGGLKEDFSLLTNPATLPAPYVGNGVYASRLGLTAASAPSDPRWESLQQFARLYKDTARLTSAGGTTVIKAQGPRGWQAATGSDPDKGTTGPLQRTPPAGVVLMPVIAKVQVVFSLLTRDIYKYPKVSDITPKVPGTKAEESAAELHGPWGKAFAGSSYDYLLHLLYTPVVTLYNPYNVALEFTEMRVVFGNVPFAVKVIRTGGENSGPQTSAPAPLDQMYFQQAEQGKLSKRFGMTLKTPTADDKPGSTVFKLLPGEVVMFSPYIDPNRTWQNEYGDRKFSDWDNSKDRTMTIEGIPGWRGDGIGFDLDWFCPDWDSSGKRGGMRTSSNETENGVNMGRAGCIAARAQDEFAVEFAPLSVPALSNNKFTVEMFTRATATAPHVSSGAIEFDYESPTGLQDTLVVGSSRTIRYPKTGTINTMAMHSHATTPIKDIANAKPFAIISAQAKTTSGGLNSDGEDGKLATKPWCFAHAVAGSSSQKVVSEHSANHSHEIDLQRLNNGTTNLLQFEKATGRGNFITGQTGNTGLKFGVQYDIPLSPVQTLAGLNGANPGGSSGYLPRFAQPIGNSWAHPLLDTQKIIRPQAGGDYLDHSFLLNLALSDHFYFSGLADQGGPFGTGKTTTDLVKDFTAGIALADPRLTLYTPDGKPAANLPAEVAALLPHTRIAAWQMMNGSFNINSTSVPAWKAMLGSIHDSQAIFNSINKPGKSTALTNLKATKVGESRISRFRLPASESESGGADVKDAYWMGPRQYTDAQLQTLAENIVKQVRERGPFLSMSEFVNRRLGTGETAQRGALQQAIDDTDLNASVAAGASAGYLIPESKVSTYKYQNVSAGSGASYQGAPGYLTQADVLSVLGNAATPRSDTFTIRGYGESRDAAGKITATATCEAVLQRTPDYLDPVDRAEILPAALVGAANRIFGRRFQQISFRWLSQNEI